jgi:hypothetical protein
VGRRLYNPDNQIDDDVNKKYIRLTITNTVAIWPVFSIAEIKGKAMAGN